MVTPGDPEELRPTQLVERTRAALYRALVTADPLADVYHHPLTASFVGHYVTALGPAIGCYREPADQDHVARGGGAVPGNARVGRARAGRLEEPYLRLVSLPGDGDGDGEADGR